MAFQKVRVLDSDVTISLGKLNATTGKTDPKSIEGYYLGFKNVETSFGETKLHHFETQSGVVAVWGAHKLDSGLSQVSIGNMVRAEFTGLGKASKGRKPSRQFDIQQDPDNKIDVLPMSSALQTFETVEQDSGDEDSSNDEDQDDDTADQAQVAALQAAERKAAVLAQLKAKGLKK